MIINDDYKNYIKNNLDNLLMIINNDYKNYIKNNLDNIINDN